MAKFSVSVPDDLWQKATALAEEGTPTSQLVQAALQDWSERHGSSLANELEPDRARLLAVAATLGEAYEETFRSGYEAALKIAEWAGFDAVSTYIRFRDWEMVWDCVPDKEQIREDGTVQIVTDGDPDPEFWYGVGLVPDYPADEVYVSGADRAFRDLWETLREGAWRSGEASDAPEGIE